MGVEIATNVPLDSVKFQILQQNRFNAFIYSKENEEFAGRGFLDQLLDHLPNIKDQLTKKPCDTFKLELPDNVDKRAWFTKATFSRFLHIVSSPDLEKCVAIANETCQLEETRKFQLSLYSKVEDGIASSDTSKNELLQAMESRIAALMEELVSTFNSAIGETFSSREMMDLQEFCHHFGDVDVSNLLSKLSKASENEQIVSPSGNEDSSFSSEDEQPSSERSRTFIRSASPRRSSSPMRRIQVGKSGPHRTPALTIKKLTGFPPCKPEGSKEPEKKIEINVARISVQDAISFFESKRKDEKVDTRNSKSFGDNSINTKKSVLRRWSSGICDSEKSNSEHTISEDKSEFVDTDQSSVSKNAVSDSVKTDMGLGMTIKTVKLNEENVSAPEVEMTSGKLDLEDYNRRKEEELSQIPIFADKNEMEHKYVEPDSSKNRNSLQEMCKVDNAGKRVQKLAEFRPKQKIREKPKAEKSFVKVNDVGKKQATNRTQNDRRNSLVSSISKEESRNPEEAKRVSSKKYSALPTTRRSWPSTPSPRTVGALLEKTSVREISSGTKAHPRKSQPPRSRQKPQVERLEVKKKEVKKEEFDTKKSSKKVEEGKDQVSSKSGKLMKMNTLMVVEVETKSGKTTKTSTVAPLEGKRVAKKSTVAPLEAKPSPRKVWEISPVSIPSMVEETSNMCEDPIDIQGRESDIGKHTIGNEKEVSVEIPPIGDEIREKMPEFSAEIHTVEISPAAWEEISHEEISTTNDDIVRSSEVRVRRSLSHMLLQESCKPEIVECGNVRIHSTIVYQRDAPKGLKRLLKFARKNNKGDTNGVSLTSPYTSEGEEDGDECRTLGNRNSKNFAEGPFSDSEPLAAQCSASSSSQSSKFFQEGYGSSKGTRSFFSLSAFRGNKS